MKNMRKIVTLVLLFAALGLTAQTGKTNPPVQNDSNSPLHLMKPAYKIPYGIVTADSVKQSIDRVFAYIESCTPMVVEEAATGREITDYSQINSGSQLRRGTFRLASYEWGVTYSALLAAAAVTGDTRYSSYVYDRFNFLARVAPYFKKVSDGGGKIDAQLKQILHPQALDDCGAVCSAMIKASMQNKNLKVDDLIDNYFKFLHNGQYRLNDGTFARNRPQHNTLWLDDMFMGIPAVGFMGQKSANTAYYDEAAKIFLQFASRMFVPEKGLYRHGWVEEMQEHPSFFWARANGWAMLTACELLDALPADHPQRTAILDLFRSHVRGVAALQGCDGFWHQLLDRNDSYLETSATAIYVYCMAHAVNKGWLDDLAYGPVALLGWDAVASQINAQGQVMGTCVGTGMGFDPAFYYYRPVSVFAAHGYGPVIWAGTEVITLLAKRHPKMNDSAVHFYKTPQRTQEPIFAVQN